MRKQGADPQTLSPSPGTHPDVNKRDTNFADLLGDVSMSTWIHKVTRIALSILIESELEG